MTNVLLLTVCCVQMDVQLTLNYTALLTAMWHWMLNLLVVFILSLLIMGCCQ